MQRPVRIAVVGTTDDRLLGDLRQLPLRPEARQFGSLSGDTEALLRFQPELMLVQFGEQPDEDIGAVRLLQRLWPELSVAVVSTPDGEVEGSPIARRLHAQQLVYPGAPGQLAATLEQLLHGSDRPPPELFVDLAHGLADEINNPLMFVSGHLQLLRSALGSDDDGNHKDQVDAALSGLQRIQASVDKLRLLSQAAAGPRNPIEVDLAELLQRAIAARDPGVPSATTTIAPGPQPVRGDREQLQLFVEALVRFADELATLVDDPHLELDARDGARHLRLVARGAALNSWRLPNTFEPFYPQRIVRGHGNGLDLFLLQTIALGHRGQATVRRRRDGALQFEFVLPSPSRP